MTKIGTSAGLSKQSQERQQELKSGKKSLWHIQKNQTA
jgi:hypothetical protein